jgi:hypothetical protein
MESKELSEFNQTPLPTPATASYIAEIANGLRQLTKESGRRDLKFLDYLLAMVEEEAAMLASRSLH